MKKVVRKKKVVKRKKRRSRVKYRTRYTVYKNFLLHIITISYNIYNIERYIISFLLIVILFDIF